MTTKARTFALLLGLSLLPLGRSAATDGAGSGLALLERGYRGQAHRVVSSGAIAYTALDSGVEIADVSNPDAPARLAHVYLPSEATDLALAAPVLVVADGESGLYFLDVSDPRLPVVLGSLAIAHARAVAAKDGLAYVVAGQDAPGTGGALHVVDFSDPTRPYELGATAPWLNGGNAVRLHGTTALVALGSSLGSALRGIASVDVSVPSMPVPAAFLATPEVPRDLDLAGSTLWVALSTGSTGALRSADVTDPLSPALLGRLALPAAAAGVRVLGSRVYVADTLGGLAIANGASPATPALITMLATGRKTVGLDVVASRILLAERGYIGTGATSVVSLPSPDAPGLRSVLTHTSVVDVATAPGRAYVLTRDALRIVDTNVPGAMTELGLIGSPTSSYLSLDVEESLAAVADASGIRLMDVSGSSPSQTSAIAIAGAVVRAVLDGSLLWVLHQNGLSSYDISVPASPLLLGSYATTLATDVSVDGTRAWLTAGADLHVLDVSRPDQPVLLDLFQSPDWLTAVRVHGDFAYVGALYDRLRTIDLTTSPPTEVGIESGGTTFGLALAGNLLYAALDRAGVEAFDLTTPLLPARAASYDTSGSAVRIAARGGDVFIAAGDGQLFHLTNPAAAPICTASAGVSPSGPVAICFGQTALLDASASAVLGCAGPPQFTWTEDGIPVPGAAAATYLVPGGHPSGSFTFAVRVSCPTETTCAATASVVVTIAPDDAPTVATNSVYGVKVGAAATFTWQLGSGTGGFNLHRGSERTAIPGLSLDPATLVGTTATLDATDALFAPAPGECGYYQVYGRRACSGASAP